jgi:NADPH:quinone reductase-like Zn-dependent oxidoreductase
MSRIVEFSESGGPEVLRFKNVDVPEAGPGQVRIRVKAIGLNRAESMWRENKYIEPVQFPARLGYEAVGTVDSVGKDVTTVAVGDEVNVIPSFSMNQYGMYGEVVLAPIHAVVKHPEGLWSVEAASIWMMFVTAYGALIEDAKITSQDAVVIPGASSSVGLAAIQIANAVGAKSIALTRTSAKRKQLTDAGAKYVIATEEEDLLKEIDKITEGHGARVVFDPVGGPTLSKLVKAMSFQGLLYLYGALSDQPTTLPVARPHRKDHHHQRPQYLAHERRSRAPKGSGRFCDQRSGARHVEANRRQGFPIRQDCRCASLSRSERADRQDRCHGLIQRGRLGQKSGVLSRRVQARSRTRST